MAQVPFALGAAFGRQTGYGTLNNTIATLTGSLTTASGIVLGSADSGVGKSGIDFDQERAEVELADVTGSFTKQAPSFLRVDPTLTIAVPLAGPRNNGSNPVVDGDMSLTTNWPGLDALLGAAGLVGAAWGAGVGYQVLPADAIPLTARVWVGGNTGGQAVAYVLQDCYADVDFDFTPGGVCIATFKLVGTRQARSNPIVLPSFNYGTQASVSPPTIQSVAFAWGGLTRGFESLKVSVSGDISEFKDSNAAGGVVKRQAGRTVKISGVIFPDDGNTDFEDEQLESTTAPTADMTFTVGTATGIGTPANAYYMALNNVDVQKLKPARSSSSLLRDLEGIATGASTNSEMELRFI